MRMISLIANSTHRALGRAVAAMCVALLAMWAAAPAQASNYATLLMDADSGQVLHEVNADISRYPASLTKMMTLYMLFETLERGLLRLEDRLPMSAHAAAQPPTKIGLRPGQSISVENAILALITESANDIAACIAEALGGSESQFAWMMTAKAREIGMTRTVFANASGLPNPNQVTTARDMGILALALLYDYPQYYPYFSTQRFQFGGTVHGNHNRMLGVYEGLDGIKTGYTRASGFNLVASAQRDGRRLIGVVLGARSPANRSIIMASLLDQAFDRQQVIEVRDSVPSTPVVARSQPVAPRSATLARATSERVASTARSASRATAARTGSRSPKPVALAAKPKSAPSARARASVAKPPARVAARSTVNSKPSPAATKAAATRKPTARSTASAASAPKARPETASVAKPKARPEVASAAKPKPKARRSQAENARTAGRDKRV